jgi:hypothetical protein
MSTALQAVEAGIGGAILPKGDFSDVPGHADLFATRIDPAIELMASVLWLAEQPLTPAASAVRDLLIEFVEEQCFPSLPPGAQRAVPLSTMAKTNGSLSIRPETESFCRINTRNGPVRVSKAAA